MNTLDALGNWTIHPGPLYRRLATAIKVAVLRGDLTPGTLLPAERQLAKQLAVGRSTVVGAYDLLRGEGVLQSRQGSGSWIAGADRMPASRTSVESLRGAALTDVDSLIDLATAVLPPARQVREALASLADSDIDALQSPNGYSVLGLHELRQAVASRFSLDGLPTTADQILVTTGGQQALHLVTHQFLHTSDSALVEDPTSPGILDLLRNLPVGIRWSRSLSSSGAATVLEAMRRSNPALVYLFACLGPEGLAANRVELRELGRKLDGYEGVVVEDASSRHLAADPPPYLAAGCSASVVTIGSMSKLFWSGLRVGWIRADPNVVLRLSRVKARYDLGTPLVSQHLATWLLARLDAVRVERLEELRARAAHARGVVGTVLPAFEITDGSEGATLWLRLPHGASGPFAELARRHGVAVVSGSSLSASGLGDAFLRIAIGLPGPAFDDGIARLADAWREYEAHGSSGLREGTDAILV